MAAKTFWFYDTAVNGFGKLDEGSQPSQVATSTISSWAVGIAPGPNNFSVDPFVYGSTKSMAIGDLNHPTTPGTQSGNGMRTLNPLTGSFSAADWTWTIQQVDTLNNALLNPTFNIRLYRSSNATGSGATAITGFLASPSPQPTAHTTIYTYNLVQVNPGVIVFNNEYLFAVIEWDIESSDTSAGRTGTTTLYQGSTKLVTPNFVATYNDTLSEPSSALDSLICVWDAKPTLLESPSLLWGLASLLWTDTTGVWGGCTAERYGTSLATSPSLSEIASSSDSLVVTAIYPNTLSELSSGIDSYVPGLIITKTLAEVSSPADGYLVSIDFYPSISESLLNFWGTAGILWGTTDGVWGGTSAVDSISTAQIFANAFAETVNASDLYNSIQIFVSALTELGTVTDSFAASLVMNSILSESVIAADSLLSTYLVNCFYNELDLLVWGISGTLWGDVTRHWGDRGVTDYFTSSQIFFCPTTESVTASDVVTGVLVIPIALSEVRTALDTYLPNLVIPVTLLESNGAIDSFTSIQVFTCFLSEAGNVQEQLAFTATGSIANILIAQRDLLIVNIVDLNDSLGIDISCFPDMDPLGVLVSGFSGLGQRIARRLTNPRGAWFWAPGECSDVRQYLNDIITTELIITIKNEVEREVLQEEAVRAVVANVTFDSITHALNISVSGVTVQGPFDFVFKVTSSQLTILN